MYTMDLFVHIFFFVSMTSFSAYFKIRYIYYIVDILPKYLIACPGTSQFAKNRSMFSLSSTFALVPQEDHKSTTSIM